jgi:hypothetical protein
MTTKRLVVALCALGLLAAGCDDDDAKPGSGTGGKTGTADGGQGGTTGTPDAAGTGGSSGTGTGGTTPAGTGGTLSMPDGGSDAADASDSGDAADGGADAAPPASQMITTAGGGTLASGGGSLWVPPGGLSADKMLTLTVRAPAANEPGRANIVGDVYEFGPDGTTFVVPVQLTLPLNVTVPADKKVVVAWLDVASGQWFPVQSMVMGDKVLGLVSHFTRFALLQIPKDDICPYSGACGGNLDGTWTYTQGCLKPMESKAFTCGDAGDIMMRQEYVIGGTVTIGSGRYTANQMISVKGTLFYTPACMAILKDSMADISCAKLQEAWRMTNVQPGQPPPQWICAGTLEQGCSCVLTQSVAATAAGTVSIAGSKATFTQDGHQPDDADDFCVQGNNLSVRTSDGDVYTAVKQ